MSPDEKIAALASTQFGVFTTEQASQAGFTPSAIAHRVRTGRWLRLYDGVFAMSGTPATWERDVFAAVTSFGPLGAASHTTSAAILGFVQPEPRPLRITFPHGQHHLRDDALVLVHQACLDPIDVIVRKAIRITAPPRTLLDLASIFTEDAFERVLDDAIGQGLASARSLRRYLDKHRESRKRGIGTFRRLIAERLDGVPQKEMERVFMKKARRSSLPEPVRQERLGRRKIDFAYPDLKIAIELDGQAIHSTGRAFRDDRRRQNEIVLSGWLVLRFTWHDVTRDWSFVEATIARALTQRSTSLSR